MCICDKKGWITYRHGLLKEVCRQFAWETCLIALDKLRACAQPVGGRPFILMGHWGPLTCLVNRGWIVLRNPAVEAGMTWSTVPWKNLSGSYQEVNLLHFERWACSLSWNPFLCGAFEAYVAQKTGNSLPGRDYFQQNVLTCISRPFAFMINQQKIFKILI